MVKMYWGGIASRMIHDARGGRRPAAGAEEERAVTERRVQFDFEVEFSNGGSLKGEGFRLDIEGDEDWVHA